MAISHLRSADLPAVAALFYRAFRDGRTPPADFVSYLETSFLSSPSHSLEQGSLVHRDGAGQIDSALLVIPMQVVVHGRVITARLMSNYMTDPQKRTRGGADMVLTIRARNQEFCFSDSANPVSADHWKAVGGHVLPIQSLDFQHVFRPAAWWAGRLRQRLPAWLVATLSATARPLDVMLRRLMPTLPMVGETGTPIDRDAFIAMAPGLVERFAVHPLWAPDELGWLLDMAARNAVDGPLQLREMRDAKGHMAGCAVFYARRGGVAKVLNILARQGREHVVVTQLLAHLDGLGCTAVQGMAQPFLVEALARHKGMRFVPRGFYCISTRHAEIVDAARCGDAYLGGLMGEDWNRLVTDFHD